MERCDCCPMRCWWNMAFYISLHVIHMGLSAGLTHLLAEGYRQLDAGYLGLKLQTDFWHPIFRTIRMQQRDHSFRYSVFLQMQSWLCVGNVLQEDNILWELSVDTHSDISDYSDNKSMDSGSDIPTTSSHKQLQFSTGSLTPQFPHLFYLALWVGTILNPFGRLGIIVTTSSKRRKQGDYSKFGLCINIL
jgi:hypothetical protein